MSPREALLNRRVGDVGTVSKFSDGPGSAIEEHTNDVAVLVGLLLQQGVTAAAIRRSISGRLATALTKAEGEP